MTKILTLLNKVKAVKLYFTMLRFSSLATIFYSNSKFITQMKPGLAEIWLAIKRTLSFLLKILAYVIVGLDFIYKPIIHVVPLNFGGGFQIKNKFTSLLGCVTIIKSWQAFAGLFFKWYESLSRGAALGASQQYAFTLPFILSSLNLNVSENDSTL